jgi:hypothetical protein
MNPGAPAIRVQRVMGGHSRLKTPTGDFRRFVDQSSRHIAIQFNIPNRHGTEKLV